MRPIVPRWRHLTDAATRRFRGVFIVAAAWQRSNRLASSSTNRMRSKGNRVLSEHALEVVSWDPREHTDLPGFAHGLTRYGGHWFDVGISVVPRDVDPMEALDKAFAKLREIVVSEQPHISYFTIDLRVASSTPVPHPH